MPSCAACDFEDRERRSSGMTEAERRRYDERIHDLQSQILELQKQIAFDSFAQRTGQVILRREYEPI